MKKLLGIIAVSLILASSVFAGFFNSRIFEVKLNGPIGISNNTFGLTDILKEELVIDLEKVAGMVPEKGLTFTGSAEPTAALNVNLFGVHVGASIGADVYGSFSIDKSIFNFFAYGIKENEELKLQPSLYTEVFASVGADVGLKFGKTRVNFNPSLFVPLFAADASNLGISFVNTSEGKFIAKIDGCINTYSQFGVVDGSLNPSYINMGNNKLMSWSDSELMNQLLSCSGFDFGTTVELPLIPGFKGLFSVRIPMKPGKFNTKTTMTAKSKLEADIMDLMSQTFISKDGDDEIDGDDAEDESLVFDDFEFDTATYTDEQYLIHRPMKLNAYVKFAPFGDFVSVIGGVGMGIRSPFSENASVFGEYYLGGNVSILGGLLGASVSTEYTNQIYVHKAEASVGLRAVELDVAVSLQGPDFTRSFSGSGFGLDITFAFGF